MDGFLNSAMRTISGHWANASPTDFGSLALAIVLIAWFFTSYYGQR